MAVTNNNEKKGGSVNNINEKEKKVSIASNTIIHERPEIRISVALSQKSSLSHKNSIGHKGSLADVYSKKSSLGDIYSISGGAPVIRDLARQSIVSIQSEKQKLEEEKWYQILLQVSVPFFIAGIGTIGAGIVLDQVKRYNVFKEIKALFVLIPALLGLKGNLDMCLASRLSTQANLGNMEEKKKVFKIVSGNILLVQVQSIVASSIVSVFAVGASALVNGNFEWMHTLLLATASTLTATMSCFILDLVLVTIITISRKFKLNPDNIATPMAASIGDVVSLTTLSVWARFLFSIHDTHSWVMMVILAFYIVILLPAWVYIVRKNEYTKEVLSHGWLPVITALFISGSGGLILDLAVDKFKGYTVFQPIINGLGGNLVSVQASRISTMLHKTSFEGVIPLHTKQWVTPFQALIRGVLPAKSARLLLLISVPGHIVFVYLADLINSKGVSNINPYFLATYVTVAILQIVLLLYLCHLLVHTMWRLRIDPDNSSIPYLTALGDLLGSTFLLVGFFFLRSIGSEYTPTVNT
ncbi:solute carrier family 41 member 3-like [Diabrotica undecimpunctata]|uniref:solute carrier family 41 member 3-like n=1 Tax=Diabrotica undecimpunctata TaxID=50387 RepID=UPI003B63857C